MFSLNVLIPTVEQFELILKFIKYNCLLDFYKEHNEITGLSSLLMKWNMKIIFGRVKLPTETTGNWIKLSSHVKFPYLTLTNWWRLSKWKLPQGCHSRGVCISTYSAMPWGPVSRSFGENLSVSFTRKSLLIKKKPSKYAYNLNITLNRLKT